MGNSRIIRVRALLGLCAVAFLLVQALLVARSFDLERKEFAMRARAEVGDVFYRTPHRAAALEALGKEVLAHPEWLRAGQDRERILARAQEALADYGKLRTALPRKLEGAGITAPVLHAVTLDALIFRDEAGAPVPVFEAQGPAQGLRLCGDLDGLGPATLHSSFTYLGPNYYFRTDIHIRYPHLAAQVLGRMKGLLAVSLMSLAAFLGACAAILRVIRHQERLSAMKTEFINTITHELNTPLSTITVAARNLQHEDVRKDPEALGRLAQVILRQNARLQRMIDAVLRLASLEAPGQRLNLEPMGFHDLLAGAAEDLRVRFADRGVEVEEDFGAVADALLLDRALMASALFNLLDNAVKYSEGAPRLCLRTRREGSAFVLEILDRGVGIPPEQEPGLFQKFFRIPAGNPNGAPGLGLGLYTVRRIVEAHGGRITTGRRKGGGSVFKVILPPELEAHDRREA